MYRTPLLLSILLVSFSLHAASGSWGQRGATRSFSIQGNRLYAADGRGLSVYDISAANRVDRIDLEFSHDETFDVALMGSTDVALATKRGVERFAIEENGALTRLGTTTAIGHTTHVAANAAHVAAVSGETLTLLERNGEGGFAIVARKVFSDPISALAFGGDHLYVSVVGKPLYVFSTPTLTQVGLLSGADAVAMSVSNEVLWTASESDGLRSIDIAEPTQPKVLGSAGENELRLRGVAAAGTRVYAFEYPDRVHVFDATKVDEPRLVTTLDEWVNVIAAAGNRLFVSGAVVEESGLAFDPGLIPRETGRPVRAFDTTSLAAPALVAEAVDLAGPISGVWTDGSIAYVVDPPYLRVLDVSTTSRPRELRSLTIENLQDHIRVKNGIGVIYGRAHVNLLDVSDPLHPRHIGTWDAQGHPPSVAAILQSRVIEANEHSGMHVVDISNPSRPVQIGGRKWHYWDVAAGDDAAYALMHGVMLVVEIAGEQTVVDRDAVTITQRQLDTAPPNSSRPDLLLVSGDDGLRLFSLADRFHPSEIDVLPMLRLGLFATGDGTAYIERDGSLHFVNLKEKLSLQPTDYPVTAPMQMSVAGDKIVVADRYSVRVFGPDTAPPPAEPKRRRSVRP
jgi:hypothetical protein